MKKKICIVMSVLLILVSTVLPSFAASDTDVYYECVEYTLDASCELKGDFPKNLNEIFTVVVNKDENSPSFEKTLLNIPANSTKSFGKIQSDKPDTYSYIVKQNKGDNPKIKYDDTEFKVIVQVITNDEGLVGEKHVITNIKTGKKVDSIHFINVYESESPKTSDNSNIIFWGVSLTSLVIAGAIVFALYEKDRKKSKER